MPLAGTSKCRARRQPAAMLGRPGRRLGVDAAVTQQHLRHAMTRVHQIAPAGVMRARHLLGRLDLRRRDHHASQRAGQQQPREQLGVLAVGLNPIRRTTRRLARRDHLHREPRRRRRPGRARTPSGPPRNTPAPGPATRPARPSGPSIPGPNRTRDSSPLIASIAAPCVDRAWTSRPHPRHRSRHGRTSSLIWGQPEPLLRPDKPPRGASGQLPQPVNPCRRPAIGSSRRRTPPRSPGPCAAGGACPARAGAVLRVGRPARLRIAGAAPLRGLGPVAVAAGLHPLGLAALLGEVRRPRRVAQALGLVAVGERVQRVERAPRARRCRRPGRRPRPGGRARCRGAARAGRRRPPRPSPAGRRRGRPASGAPSRPRRRCGRARSGCSPRRRRGAPPSTTCSWPAACAARPRAPAPAPLGAPR